MQVLSAVFSECSTSLCSLSTESYSVHKHKNPTNIAKSTPLKGPKKRGAGPKGTCTTCTTCTLTPCLSGSIVMGYRLEDYSSFLTKLPPSPLFLVQIQEVGKAGGAGSMRVKPPSPMRSQRGASVAVVVPYRQRPQNLSGFAGG